MRIYIDSSETHVGRIRSHVQLAESRARLKTLSTRDSRAQTHLFSV